jgi:DsbC/DsbD-like thiol-disulfide interchange protein
MEPFMNGMRMTRRGIVRSGLAALFLPAAAEASEQQRYKFRLIAGEPLVGMLRAGIDIALAPGWKTYWRMPGDAGVPPQFDWSGSENARAIEVLWPAPTRFNDEGGETVGYKERVVFPLRVRPERVAEPVRLRLAISFAVCKEICIPAEERADLVSWQGDPEGDALLSSFEQRVPIKADLSSPLRVTQASIVVNGGQPELRLALAGTPPADFDVFIESKDTSYFRAPKAVDASTYAVAIEGQSDPGRLKGAPLKLTMVGRNLALEQDVVVD